MKLSTRTRYGTRILLELARNSENAPIKVSKIASRQDIPVKYLEQLIRVLKQADLVTSVRGAKGGHMLSKPPETISLGQIVRLFEGQASLVECVSSPEKCRISDECNVRKAWKEATSVLYKSLDAITIADLLC